MNKIISISLWGENPKYLMGAFYNAIICRQIYSDWKVRFYIPEQRGKSLNSTIELLKLQQNVEFKEMNDEAGLFWRFRPAFDSTVDLFVVRDADSRPSIREYFCVLEWLKSNEGFHIMRDHPHHDNSIMGGIWGMKKDCVDPNLFEQLYYNYCYNHDKGNDHKFLWNEIYPLIKDNCLVHDEICREDGIKFPLERNIYRDFEGEIFDSNNVPDKTGKDILIEYLEEKEKKKSLKEIVTIPKVSVIVSSSDPLDCINSIRESTYKNIEIIVVTTNNTELKNIVCIIDEKIDINKGLKIAEGDFICFINEDYLFRKNKIERQIQGLKNNKLGFCCEGVSQQKNQKINYSSVMISKTIKELSGRFEDGYWQKVKQYTNCLYLEQLVYRKNEKGLFI